MEEEKMQPPQENKESHGDAKEPDSTAPVAAVNVSKVDPPKDTNNAETNTKKRKRKPLSCFEIWTIVLGSVGILVAGGTGLAIIGQDVIASRTLKELQRQTELSKDQLVNEKGATFEVDVNMLTEPNLIEVGVRNDPNHEGRLAATDFKGTLVMEQREIPGGKVLWKMVAPITAEGDRVASGQVAYNRIDIGTTPEEFQQIVQLHQELKMEVSYMFNDGLGDKRSGDSCWEFIGARQNDGTYKGLRPVWCRDAAYILDGYAKSDLDKKKNKKAN